MIFTNAKKLVVGLAAGWVFAGVANVAATGAAAPLQEIPSPATSQDVSVISLLLNEQWQRQTGAEQERARELGQAALRADPGNLQLTYAYALNRMQHYRYRDAVPLLKQVVRAQPTNLSAWQLLTWAQIVNGQHDASLVSMREMKQAMTAAAAADDDAALEMYQHAGRLTGFLQGPVSSAPNADLLQLTITTLADGATAQQLEVFNRERDAVLQKYDQITRDEAAAAASFLQNAAAKGAVEAEVIEKTNESLDQRRETIQPEVSRLTVEATSRISSLDQQAGPLLAEATALDAQANQLAWTLNNIRADILLTQQASFDRRNPEFRFGYQYRLSQLYALAQQTEIQLANVRNRLVGLQSQLNVLGVQRDQVQNLYGGEIAQQRNELQQIDRQQKKNTRKLQDIIDGPDRITGKALQLANKKDLMSTYYIPPLEIYRLEFLDKLGK